jgi:hypothetical protein
MLGPLGGDDGDPRVPTMNATNIDSAPLRGDGTDLGAPTINARNVYGGPLWRQYRRSECAHHQHKKHR